MPARTPAEAGAGRNGGASPCEVESRMRLLDPRALIAFHDAARETHVLETAVFGDGGLVRANLLAHQELLGDRGLDHAPRLIEIGGALHELALGIDAQLAEHVQPRPVAEVLAPRVETAPAPDRLLDRQTETA